MGMFNFSAAAVIIHIMVKPIQEHLSKIIERKHGSRQSDFTS